MVPQMDQLQQDLATLAKIEELSQQLRVERQVHAPAAFGAPLTCSHHLLCYPGNVVGSGLCHQGDLIQSG